ncbi:MAG: class I SAM-dependent methyltransferase [Parvularculaceae bacterium]
MRLKIWVLAGAACLFAAGCDNGDRRNAGDSDSALVATGQGEDAANAAHSDQNADIDVWLQTLEVNSRELYSARGAVVKAVELDPGVRVADVGAGTGLYTLLFAEAAGHQGVVYAVDIEPKFLDLINTRATDLGLSNVVSVLGRSNSITLPDNSVDVVFIADTYHYFEDRQAIMKTILTALKPGGFLYVVDFDLVEGKTRPAEQQHVRFGKPAVITEIEFFGFEYVGDVTPPGLEENYMIKFKRP